MVTPTAYCLVRDRPPYRQDAFHAALRRLGFKLGKISAATRPDPRDLLVIWNRYGVGDRLAKLFERDGARVLVAENGYLPMRGTKKAFALALNHHNGAGAWPRADHPRAHLLDVELRPWRPHTPELLVLPQRGIGPSGVAMPRAWPDDVRRRLNLATRQRVRIRRHPGTDRPTSPTLEEDLEGAGACVTWGSGAALKALVAGVPVFHEFKRWIGAPASTFGIAKTTEPARPDNREQLLERVAWAQWSVEELETGEPLARLLEVRT